MAEVPSLADARRRCEAARWPEQHDPQCAWCAFLAARRAVGPCSHADFLTAECEGWENPAEPLSIRVSCSRCGRHIDVRVDDPSLLDWEE